MNDFDDESFLPEDLDQSCYPRYRNDVRAMAYAAIDGDLEAYRLLEELADDGDIEAEQYLEEIPEPDGDE